MSGPLEKAEPAGEGLHQPFRGAAAAAAAEEEEEEEATELELQRGPVKPGMHTHCRLLLLQEATPSMKGSPSTEGCTLGTVTLAGALPHS